MALLRERINNFLAKRGNASLAAGALFGISSFACPCPFCILSTITLTLHGAWEKVGCKLWK